MKIRNLAVKSLGVFIIFRFFTTLYAQRVDNHELVISSDYGAGTEYTHEATLDLTGWGWSWFDRCSGRPSTDGACLNVEDDADAGIGFDSPSSTGSNWPDMVWGWYILTYECSDGFSKSVHMDFRDYKWSTTYKDTYIKYYHNLDCLKWSVGDGWSIVGDTLDIWEMWEDSQNRDSLLVRVAGSYNVPGDQIYINGSWRNQPYSYWAGWTSSCTITAKEDFYSYGYKRTFSEWSDNEQSENRGSETFGDASSTSNDSLYEFIALYDSEIPTPGNFDLSHPSGNPYMTWTTVTGDSMDGYIIKRSYNGGNFNTATTIEMPSTSSWTDNDVDFDKDGVDVMYCMYTKDLRADTSIHTDTLCITGYWAIKKEARDDSIFLDDTGTDFRLSSNLPNPFNPTTTISYSLASESQVTLSIYNVLGERIRTLESTLKPKGAYSVVWDSQNDQGSLVSAGIYIYRIEAIPTSGENQNPFIDSKKMLLTK